MDPAVIVGFGMDKVRKRMAELLADPKVPYTDACDVLWKEIADYDAARVAESRARYEGVEDPYDEYADDNDSDSKEDEESEAGGGEAADDDEEKKNPRMEEEAPRILLSRL